MAKTFFAPFCSRQSVKPARRGARVAADEAGRIDAEVAQRLFKLQAAAADVGAGIAPQLYNGSSSTGVPALSDFCPLT